MSHSLRLLHQQVKLLRLSNRVAILTGQGSGQGGGVHPEHRHRYGGEGDHDLAESWFSREPGSAIRLFIARSGFHEVAAKSHEFRPSLMVKMYCVSLFLFYDPEVLDCLRANSKQGTSKASSSRTIATCLSRMSASAASIFTSSAASPAQSPWAKRTGMLARSPISQSCGPASDLVT